MEETTDVRKNGTKCAKKRECRLFFPGDGLHFECISGLRRVCGSFKTVMFQQIVLKTDQVKKSFATVPGEMYPVRLCLHILPDAFLHDAAGSWSGLSDSVGERSVLS